ncbi:hypothetical protein ACSLBF_14755 [Pseudoalteromonas sp. T1lg65]|uniref:hypothetical protein n=1 Tax=Pseudoalteromonas sp. T1lg65 TaxID=2077101 RepID=UPI003F78C71F
MKVKVKKLKNLNSATALKPMQTPQVAGGMPIEITNFRQCILSQNVWGCTASACKDFPV